MAEAFRILAEHFAEKDNINVTLSDKGEAYSVPSEKRIVLPDDVPDEMFGVTLATLLHESYHLKCSDPSCKASNHGNSDSPMDFITNVLEDIRIDAKILEKYPNARNLYSDLVDYIMTKKGLEFSQCPKEIKILKEIILRSYSSGQEFERFFSQEPEIKKFFDDNKSEIEVLTLGSIRSKDTRSLEPFAKRLMKLVFPTWKEDFLKQFNGSKALQESKEAAEKAQKDYSEAVKDFNPIYREQNNLNNAKRKNTKDMKTQEQVIESYENWIKSHEETPEDAEKYKDHLEQYKKDIKRRKEMIDELKAKEKELEEKWNEFRKKHSAKEIAAKREEVTNKEKQRNEKAQAHYQLQGDMKDKESLADKELSKLLSKLNGFATSFSNIDKKDFIITERINQNLSDRLMEFLKNKQERRVVSDDGKISPNKLPTFFDPANIFEQRPEDLNKKTRVFFVIDRSSSMSEGLHNDYNVSKHKAVTNALDMIFKVLDKAIKDEGIDIEYALYAFNESPFLIKDFDQEIKDKNEIYKGIYPMGGTDPSGVLEQIEEVFCDDVNTKEVVLFMTDGDFGSVGYEKLESLLLGRKKWIFLGMDIRMDYPESKRIFGRYNITQTKEIQKALTNAIEDAI